MLKFLFKNGGISALLIWVYSVAHGLMNEPLMEEAEFFSQAMGTTPFWAIAIRSFLIVIICITWSEAFRFRSNDDSAIYIGFLLSVMISIVLPSFYILPDLVAMLLTVFLFRRLLSSLEAISPTAHLFEMGVLIAVLALIRIEFLLFILPVILMSILLGRVDLRLLLLPFLGLVITAWMVWGTLDLLGENWLTVSGDLFSFLGEGFPSELNSDFLQWGSVGWLPLILWAANGALGEKANSRAIDRQLVQTLFWSMLFLLLLSVLSFTGGRGWWPLVLIPASMLISKDIGRDKSKWQTDLLVVLWLFAGFSTLLF